MLESIDTELLNIIWIFLILGVGWIVLRFILNIARRIFSLGCMAILVIGFILIVMQFLQGS